MHVVAFVAAISRCFAPACLMMLVALSGARAQQVNQLNCATTAGSQGQVVTCLVPAEQGVSPPFIGTLAVATINLSVGDQITATTDTNGVTVPVAVNLCQTVPANGACAGGGTPMPSVTTQINSGDTPTFGVFVSGTRPSIPFDPADNRVFVRFTDLTGTVRGATSVAVQPVTPMPFLPSTRELDAASLSPVGKAD